MSLMASIVTFETVSFVGLLVLFALVLWLCVVVIRLRVEASINRRVITSLQKVRPVAEAKAGTEKFAMLLRQTLFGMVALVILLVLYEVIA